MTVLTWIQRVATAAHDCFATDLDPEMEFALPGDSFSSPQHTRRPSAERYCVTLNATPLAGVRDRVDAWKTLEAKAGLVPAGETCLAADIEANVSVFAQATDQQTKVHTDPFYLDRFAVTNEQFRGFVADGGYDQQTLWPADVLPYVLQFVDQTGQPGPKSWSRGEPSAPKRNHPVVGISWFEANAFAHWSGQRLPTAAEWQRAASWATDGSVDEARYPWGNVFDPQRANIWHSQHGDTVPVDEYASGATTNGIYQLVGNTWEWTSDEFTGCVEGGSRILFERPTAEIRGGAYDTYLETQATCQFRSGQPLLHRGANVGFRCCIGVQELPCRPDPSSLLEITG